MTLDRRIAGGDRSYVVQERPVLEHDRFEALLKAGGIEQLPVG